MTSSQQSRSVPVGGRAEQPGGAGKPLLTVAIPTRDRPDLLRRALASVTGDAANSAARAVEIVVSDNASDEDGEGAAAMAEPLLAAWPGPTRYVRHRPPVGMVDNFNACVAAARGQYVLLLHDDDYLLPGGVDTLVRTLTALPGCACVLFGVEVVDLEGRVQRRQTFRADHRLDAPDALRRVLTNSSWVRFPAIAVRRSAYDAVGPFDTMLGGPTDFEMWARLFARFGVHCSSATVAAYTVHPGAATTSTFTPSTIDILAEIFDRARGMGVLDEGEVRRSQAAYFHQFILGGTYRWLRAGDRPGARRVMRLFQLPAVRRAGLSPRWLPVRAAFAALTVGSGKSRRRPKPLAPRPT